MIPIEKPSFWIRGNSIEPRIVIGRLEVIFIPVKLEEGVRVIRMVQYNVKQYGNASIVALVDESLKRCFCAIGFVQGQEESGVVSPTVIAVELIHRHEFNRIYAKPFEVIKGVKHGLKVPFFAEVAYQQFINDQGFTIRPGEVLIRPIK